MGLVQTAIALEGSWMSLCWRHELAAVLPSSGPFHFSAPFSTMPPEIALSIHSFPVLWLMVDPCNNLTAAASGVWCGLKLQ